MKKVILILFVLQWATVSYADYLVTTRKTSVKADASSASAPLVQVDAETTLLLLDDGKQRNGYYHVSGDAFEGEGWIYRTFVRRYQGVPETVTTEVTTMATSEDVAVRIVDVGGGQCNLIKLPGNKYVIYDAGHWTASGRKTLAQVQDYIPKGSSIELMVLSHTDGDHIGAAENILRNYKVKKLLWTGFERSMISSQKPTDAYTRLVNVLKDPPYAIENINLHERDSTIIPGTKLRFGPATLTFLSGFGEPMPDWPMKSDAERLNAVSIIMKLEYNGRSVLFCGDAVGRHIGDAKDALIATEKFVVDNAANLLKSTVVIAPHHGADNGSSTAFIKKVQPKVVVFSSGHIHNHPTKSAAERYLAYGVDINNIFRTDRGDDERNEDEDYYEWDHLQIEGCKDEAGDDDIDIVLFKNGGMPNVSYVWVNEPCEAVQ